MNKHPLADCDNCSLRNRPHVPSKIPRGAARFAIVGIAPAVQEVYARQPFVGPSGKLLKEVLKRHKINPDECLLTNVVSCRLEDDNADPPADAVKACKPRLVAELLESKAQRILATGNVPSRAFLQTKDGILKTRVGPSKSVALTPGNRIEIVPTVHPAAALRLSDYFPYIVTDVGKLKATSSTWQNPKHKVADTERKALAYIRFLESFDKFAVDIETDTDKDVAFEHPEDTEILCVGVAYDIRHVVIFPGEILRIPIIGKLFGLLLAKAKLIAQNGKFDVPVLHQFHSDIKLNSDTMLQHYILDERTGIHKLEVMAMEILGTPPWKWMTKKYTSAGHSFAAVPRDVLYYYNAIDCATTYGLYEQFVPQLEAQGLTGLHEFLVRASAALMQVEREGVNVDLPYLEELDESYKAELETLEQPLHEWVDNPRSPDQVLTAIHRLGVNCASTRMPLLREIRKGMDEYQSSFTEARDVVRFIDALEAYRKAFKQYSTYVRGLKKRVTKGKVHTSYLLHGTVMGRLSSRNPNLQNQPRGPTIRKLFIPGHPDHVFIKADYAQGELRIVAILADEPYYAERFVDGRDVFADTQEELFKDRIDKELRVKTKSFVHGSNYGMILGHGGDQGKQKALEIFPELPAQQAYDAAYAYQQKMFSLVPNVLRWQQETRKFVLNGGLLTNYKGRRRHFWLITNQNKHEVLNECLAFVPQSTLSDMCLTGLAELVERGYKVRLSTHDEVVVECHERQAEQVEREVAGILSEAAKEFSEALPFPVETSIGRSWGAC
jgi:uracil-DNA glycosylase family 4